MIPNVAPKPKLPAYRAPVSTKGSRGLQFGPSGSNPKLPQIGKPMATSKHPGFAAVQEKIEKKEGVSAKSAGAILANSTRHASAAAKKKNPFLKHVK